MTFVFQFMLMLVSLYGLNTRPAGALPVEPELEPLDEPLDEPLLDDPPELDPLEDPPPELEPLDEPLLEPPQPAEPPLEEPLPPPLEEPLPPPGVTAQSAGAQSAGVASGVQLERLVCAWMHS
jgi:hypothetical protein